eukprot:Gb_30333 [translate_table: standard]
MELGRNQTFCRRRKPVALLDLSKGGKMSFTSLNKGVKRSQNKGLEKECIAKKILIFHRTWHEMQKIELCPLMNRIDSAIDTALFFSPSLSLSSNPSSQNLFFPTKPLVESNPVL